MDVPIIDVGPFLDDPSGNNNNTDVTSSRELFLRRTEVARSIGKACQTHGFFYVSGLGEDTLASIQRGIHQTKTFFGHPNHTFRRHYKRRCSSKLSKLYRGYTQTGGGNNCVSASELPELKESFTIGAEGDGASPMHGPNLWPEAVSYRNESSNSTSDAAEEEHEFCDSFKRDMTDYFDRLLGLSRIVARALALSLELREDFFTERMQNPVAQLVGFRYPPEPKQDGDGDDSKNRGKQQRQISCGEHTDCGFLTLLVQTAPGLEVYARSTQTWHTVPPKEGTVLVNLGDLTQFWTRGKYKSTPHRVHNRSKDGFDRHSLVFFANCDFDARLDDLGKNDKNNEEKKSDDGNSLQDGDMMTAGEYILKKLGLMWLMDEDEE